MLRIASVFGAMDPIRRVFATIAVVGTFAAVLMLARVANAPNMALLYSGLEPAAAGEVIRSLDQMGATYDVRESAIFVESNKRDMRRMALAAEGKPSASTAGYEILDNLSGFGTTSQMFDAAYWRAKEGELARTIVSNPGVRSARVHIASTPTRNFRQNVPGAASVVVTTASGGLSGGQAKALKFLVASAVEGLAPEQVSIIDAEGGLISSGDDAEDPSLVSGDRAATLKANVERLLEARVGYGKAIVEVNVDTINEREEILERTFDPDGRVAISTVTEEVSSNAQDNRAGQVTVAGNLPDGDAGGSGAASNSNDSQTREQVNYEVSETQREVVRGPGAVRRLSVAVLVDGIREIAADGTETWAARPEEEIAALQELVASTVGFDEARGDVITIRSMEFLAPEPAGTEIVSPGLFDTTIVDPMKLIQLGTLAVVSLFLGLFVVRPILSAPGAGSAQAAIPPPPLREPAANETVDPGEALSGEIDDGDFMPDLAVIEDAGSEIGQSSELPALGGGNTLQDLVEGRQDETATVLREWMEDGSRAA